MNGGDVDLDEGCAQDAFFVSEASPKEAVNGSRRVVVAGFLSGDCLVDLWIEGGTFLRCDRCDVVASQGVVQSVAGQQQPFLDIAGRQFFLPLVVEQLKCLVQTIQGR